MIGKIMQTRRSVREFTAQKPEAALIEELIEYAITAPSASNHQPWRFYIVDDGNIISRMAEVVQQAIDQICQELDETFLQAFKQYGDYFVRFKNAPVVIVPVYKPLRILSHLLHDRACARESFIEQLEWNSGIVSTSLAIQNLLLYAHSKGLGASCMTGPLLAADELKTLLKITGGWDITCLIPIGYTDEAPEVKPRKSAQSVIRWVSSELS